ncbi:MAG: hypothetical protein E3J75_00750 [Dehalococcoidia bacterium]|nr:MAG: hypothetical protein E3J75_00750 [Dehalococcoidia bacterium]
MNEEELKSLWERHRQRGGIIRSWEEWKDKVGKAYIELIKIAKEIPYDLMRITYGKLGARIGLYPLSELFQLKIGHIVGACSVYEHEHGRPLISALVVNEETNRPGKGFWGLPGIPPHLRKNIGIEDITVFKLDEGRESFWINQIKQIDKCWKAKES